MKKLSRDEMKNVAGGNVVWHPPTVYCKTGGAAYTSTNDCAYSVGVCNLYGGVDYCLAGYYA